jgi:ribonuclease G
VNTGRFVGSRGRSSGGRLEDTITKNNLEAVKEVVRQLRLRDIGGIIVIDFIDMANPKNRAMVQDALQSELERDRTKTYVVEISPLGLVEMTRQNVTEGPREILTVKCPTCAGDGIVVSGETAAVEIERRLRELAVGARAQAFRIELNSEVADALVGPAGERLATLEDQTRRRFVLEPRDDVPSDHFHVLARGKRAELVPDAPFAVGDQVELQLVEIDRRDAASGVGKLDGYDVAVAQAAKQVGKKVKVRLDRITDGVAYATLVRPKPKAPPPEPLSAEIQAEKPTRQRARKAEEDAPKESKRGAVADPEPEADDEPVAEELVAEEPVAEQPADGEATAEKPKRKTRRGSRGGRGRKKKAPEEAAAVGNGEAEVVPEDGSGPKIHVPAVELAERAGRTGTPDGKRGRAAASAAVADAVPDGVVAESADGDASAGEQPPKKRTRRGSRGGRRRRKPAAKTDASAPGEGEPAES